MIDIVICDDSKEYIEILKSKINYSIYNKFGMECNITCLTSIEEFTAFQNQNKIDIVFIDIMINNINSINWALNNLKYGHTQYIFMTSFPQSAYNISEVNCCYFIIKPKLTDAMLDRALQRALQNTMKKEPNLSIIRSGNKNITINFQDIIYIETFNNNLVLHFKDKEITIYSTLKDFSKSLPPNFLRCHKCFMINMCFIEEYEPYRFITKTREEISIPPKKYRAVINAYKKFIKNI